MRPVDVIRRVAPHARPEYLAAFEAGDGLFAAAGVTTPLRLAHFLAQILEETGGLVITTESGNYSAERMCEVWPGRFHSIAAAEPYAHNAEKLFNQVYANRMGNGPPSSGDGFLYRGRGILQTTGREAYRKYGKRCGVDFESNPDLVFDARYALMPALAEWTDSKCNELADRDDIHSITKRVNGGETNLGERERWLHVVKPIITSVELVPVAPKPQPPPAPPDHVGGFGALLAALTAAWQSAGHAHWIVVALLVAAGIATAIHFTKKA